MKTTPYWWEDAHRETDIGSALPETADVVIVGSGYTGLTASLVLARAGVTVVVIEAGVPGEGASSRNGGMVGPSFHKLGIAGLRSKFGAEKTNEILKESIGFVEFLRRFLQTEDIDANFVQTGRFRGALKPEHFDAMARDLESLQTACGVKGHMVSRQDQQHEIGSERFFGGMVFDLDGGLHPGKYHAGLLNRVREAGVKVIAQTLVQNVVHGHGTYDVHTTRGVIKAEKVAVCTNGYTGAPFTQLQRRILPLRSALIATEELGADTIDRLMPRHRMYGDSRRIIAYYRPSPDGKRILFGGRASGYTENVTHNVGILRRSMTEIFPELKAVKITHSWSGLVAYTFDHTPHIGQLGGLHFAMGYCGSGVARSSYFGTKLGYKMLGDDEKGRTAFDDIPMESKPFYRGNPWFMPAVLAWHRVADRFGL